MRCLALAEAWEEAGGPVHFMTATAAPSMDARIREVGGLSEPVGKTGSVEDADATAALARGMKAGWVVADGYDFGEAFEARLVSAEVNVLTLDDLGERADFAGQGILNQNAYADEALYAKATVPVLRLFGSRYALMRREFRDRRDPPRRHLPRARRLLVSMGGGDFRGVSPVVLDALNFLRAPGLECTLLVGPNNPFRGALEEKARVSRIPVRVEVATRDMAGWMAWADAAVQAGGSTVWESCRMGLPSLIVCLAENQRRIVESAARAGAGEDLGWYHELNAETLSVRIEALLADEGRRAAMSAAASALVDGQGAFRVRDALLEALI